MTANYEPLFLNSDIDSIRHFLSDFSLILDSESAIDSPSDDQYSHPKKSLNAIVEHLDEVKSNYKIKTNNDTNSLKKPDNLYEYKSVFELTKSIEKSLRNKSIRIADSTKAQLIFSDFMFYQLFSECLLEPVIQDILKPLRFHFIASVLSNGCLYLNSCKKNSTPIFKLIEKTYLYGLTWYEIPGKAGSRFLNRLEKIVSNITNMSCNANQELLCPLEDLSDLINTELRKSKMIEDRVCEFESSSVNIKKAHRSVNQLFQNTLAGRHLPPQTAEFILGPLKSELLFSIINEGEQCETWLRWVGILKSLSWAFQPEKNRELTQKVYRYFPVIIRQLDKTIKLKVCNDTEYQHFINRLEHDLLNIMKGKEIECIVVEPLQEDLNSMASKVMINEKIKSDISSIKPGSWFLFTDYDNKTIRCKLALRQPEVNQLLFINHHGHKVMQKTFEEVSLCLSTRVMTPLAIESPFPQALKKTLNLLTDYYKSKAPRQASSDDKIHNNTSISIASSDNNEAHSTDVKKEAPLIKAVEEGETAPQDNASPLSIGAWLEIPGEAGALIRAKIAVNLQKTQKYIFVDRLGNKVSEISYSDLNKMLNNNNARLLSRGEKFEDKLALIVRGLRKTF